MKKKKIKTFNLMPLLISLVASSCTKEKVKESYSPIGYWRGNAYIIHTAVLNKPNGTARIYFRITGIDTANATKADGFYTVSGNSFKVFGIHKRSDPNYDIRDTIYIETTMEPATMMKGQLYSTFSSEIVDCTLRKQ